jgi:hypothetical protein
MSIISLTIAPLMEDDDDWDSWYYGLIPLAAMLIGTYLVYHFFWRNVADITAPVGVEKMEAVKDEPMSATKDEVEVGNDGAINQS